MGTMKRGKNRHGGNPPYMPPWIYTVLGRRWFRINEKNGGSDFSQSRRFIGAWKCVCCMTAFFFCRRPADTINQIIYHPFFLTALLFLATVNILASSFLFARIITEIKNVKTIVMKAGKM